MGGMIQFRRRISSSSRRPAMRWKLLVPVLLVTAACSSQPGGVAHDHAAPTADTRPVLYDTLGGYSYKITTASAPAQRWFDQGLRLVYAFNHNEAQKAFREAVRLDP